MEPTLLPPERKRVNRLLCYLSKNLIDDTLNKREAFCLLARAQDFQYGAPEIEFTQFVSQIITRGSQFRLYLVWGRLD